MNHTSEREVIMQKMKATFEYRQRLVHDPEGSTTILSVFPRFLDTKGLILQDFTLLFGSETASRLLERWPTVFKAKVIRLGETLTPTPLLKRLLSSAKQSKESSEAQDSPEWDSDISSFLLLLHLLSPQASGRKKIQRISISQAIDHLVVFHKACRSIQEHLELEENRQPYILASGSSKEAISHYFIVVDKKLIPCQESSSLAAIDELFKVHFVFSLSYDSHCLSLGVMYYQGYRVWACFK
ncbi:uncharacterized protein LOC128021672 [Carassius gibelio]|nr:uncharacterized protein LOC128021672 [Carassius gibelio]